MQPAAEDCTKQQSDVPHGDCVEREERHGWGRDRIVRAERAERRVRKTDRQGDREGRDGARKVYQRH